MANPFVVEVRGPSDNPSPGVQVMFSVISGGGTLSVTSGTTDSAGRAESALTLGPNPGTNTVEVAVPGIQEKQTLTATAQVGDIPDPNLRAAIEDALGLAAGATITADDLAGLTELSAANDNVGDLAGLEHATNLKKLILDGNRIHRFGLEPLQNLTNLKELWVRNNNISDIRYLSGLTNLELLYLRNNTISDISPLTQLTKLKRLELNCNRIVDIAPLVAIRRLGAEAHVNLSENPLNSQSVDVHIPALKDRGVTVVFVERNPYDVNCDGKVTDLDAELVASHSRATDGIETYDVNGDGVVNILDLTLVNGAIENAEGVRTPKTLEIVSGANQQGLPSSALENPFVVEVRDQSDKPLPEIEVTFSVTGGGGTLSETSTTTDSNGRAESTLTLGPNPGTNTVEATVAGIEANQTFSAEGIRTPKTLEIVTGANQQGLPSSALENPFVVEVRDQSDKPLPEIEVTFSVTGGGGTLSETSTTTDSNGRAESTLTLGPNPGTNTVAVSITGIQEQQTFTAEGIRTPKAFWIITGFDQKGTIGEALPRPIVVYVAGQSGEPFPDVEVTFTVTGGGGTLSVTSTTTDSDGRAETTLTLGPDPGTNSVEVAVTGIQEKQTASAIGELPPTPEDVNRDEVVDILDLVLIASVLGDEGANLAADVNGDRVVDILDLVLVAGALGNAAAAPSSDPQALAILTAKDVGEWLAQAQGLDLTDAPSQRGVLILEQLLAALTPRETALLPNYPNPFNPETWLPYRLAEAADVQISIYNTAGALIRQLDMGHQSAGFYTEKGQAAHWDGRNAVGATVASGVYFYHLSAGDHSETRRLVILK